MQGWKPTDRYGGICSSRVLRCYPCTIVKGWHPCRFGDLWSKCGPGTDGPPAGELNRRGQPFQNSHIQCFRSIPHKASYWCLGLFGSRRAVTPNYVSGHQGLGANSARSQRPNGSEGYGRQKLFSRFVRPDCRGFSLAVGQLRMATVAKASPTLARQCMTHRTAAGRSDTSDGPAQPRSPGTKLPGIAEIAPGAEL